MAGTGTTSLAPRRGACIPAIRSLAAALLALLTLMAAVATPTLAQAPAPQAPASTAPATPILDEQGQADEEIARALQALETLKLEADRIEAEIQREGLTDADLAALRAEIDPIGEQALAVAEEIAPKVQEAEARLEQLGSVPEEGEPAESELITSERSDLNERLSALQAIIKQAGLLSLRADQISASIVERRRNLFTDRIFKRHGSALNPVLWLDALKATPTVANRLWMLLSDWSGVLGARLDLAAVVSIGAALIVLGLVLLPLRRLLLRVAARDPGRTQPPRLHRTSAAAWLVTFNVAVPAAGLLMLYAVFAGFELLPARVDRVVAAGVRAIILFMLIQGLSWAMLAPLRPTWRLFPLADAAVRRVNAAIIGAAAVFAIGEIAEAANHALFAPLAVTVANDVLIGLLIAAFLGVALVHSRPSSLREAPDTPQAVLIRWPWIYALAWVWVLAIPVAAILGYLSLASFLAAQLIIGGTIVATLILAMQLVDSLLTGGLEGADGIGGKIAAMFGLHRDSVLQIGILLSGVLRVVLAMVAISFLLVPWGIASKDVFGWFKAAFFGFQVGELTISLAAILVALAIFLIGIVITRAIQRWLDQRLLPHTRLDVGIRNSLRTTFGYAGIIAAAAIGFTFLGLDLSNLALVAGALSVGIGFGLQSVVNNFVSGLILLAERPIKEGDWIVVGSEEGYVSKISVRSTQIETFDRATVIVPNSDLISGVVKNWMHQNMMGRIRVAVGVTYAADPDKVEEVLLKCAEDHPAILRDPEPRVYFQDFGASSLDFELRAYINNVDVTLSTRSDLRFAILKGLREAGIEIPFPQQDLHLKDIERIEKALAADRSRAPRAARSKER